MPSLVCLKNRTFEYSALYCKWLKCDCSCFTIIHKMEWDESFTWRCIGRTPVKFERYFGFARASAHSRTKVSTCKVISQNFEARSRDLIWSYRQSDTCEFWRLSLELEYFRTSCNIIDLEAIWIMLNKLIMHHHKWGTSIVMPNKWEERWDIHGSDTFMNIRVAAFIYTRDIRF